MLCRIFHSEGVQPARTLQLMLSHSLGQRHRDRIYCSWMGARVHTHACFLGVGGGGGVLESVCMHMSVHLCVSAYLCLYLQFFLLRFVCLCVCVLCLWCSSWTDLFFFSGTGILGAPNSVAAKVRSAAAVPANDVWWRGEQIRTAIAQRADTTSWRFDAHVHAHARRHTHAHTPRLTGPGLSAVKRSDCQLMFIHRQRHLSSAATYYCHPRIYTAELKGSPAWRLGEDSGGFCVSLTSELTA